MYSGVSCHYNLKHASECLDYPASCCSCSTYRTDVRSSYILWTRAHKGLLGYPKVALDARKGTRTRVTNKQLFCEDLEYDKNTWFSM